MNEYGIPNQKERTFTIDSNAEITYKVVESFIQKHLNIIPFYEKMEKLYTGEHEIYDQKKKTLGKPDHRIGVNFARYVVDTATGYFAGNAIKYNHVNESVKNKIDDFRKRNYEDDNDAELSKICDIYGLGYKLLYQDEEAATRVAVVNPQQGFLVFSKDVKNKPQFGVIYSELVQALGKTRIKATVYLPDGTYIYDDVDKALTLESEYYYSDIPMVQFVQNEEKQGRIELIWSLVNEYNGTLSEKANDVAYFADAYLKMIGVNWDNSTKQTLRDNRVILTGKPLLATEKVDIGFLEKPNADGTQENLLDRLEKLIYQMSMTFNSNDEKLFSAASGVALEIKMQNMKNSSLVKERKFEKALSLMYKLYFKVQLDVSDKDVWYDIEYSFNYSMPRNTKDEADTARALSGITSKETQLKAIPSLVPDIDQELKRIESENREDENSRVPAEEVIGIKKEDDDS